jgi:hypothetical protein
MSVIYRSDLFRIHEATTIQLLREAAFEIAERMPKPLGIVCGPITSGGFNDSNPTMRTKKNLILFNLWIGALVERELSVFSQIPFESAMFRLYKRDKVDIIEEFYRPLFERYISIFYFIRGWETSEGATKERGIALALRPRRLVMDLYQPPLVGEAMSFLSETSAK